MILLILLLIVAMMGVIYFISTIYVGSSKDKNGKRHTLGFLLKASGGELGGKTGCLVWIGYFVILFIVLEIVSMLFLN